MKQLALVMLSVCVAFAQTQQVSVGNNSPNIDHVAGNLTITYTLVEQGPCTIVSGTSPDSAGRISSDYASSLFKDADVTRLPFGPSDRPFISDAGTSLPNTFSFPPSVTADGLPTSLASPVKPLSWLEDSNATSDRPLTGGVIADYPSSLSVITIIKLSLSDVIAGSTVADSVAGTHIDNPIFARALTVRTALDSPPFANTLVGSSSILTGTDYASLSKSLADLTVRGDAITGWSLTYIPGDHR